MSKSRPYRIPGTTTGSRYVFTFNDKGEVEGVKKQKEIGRPFLSVKPGSAEFERATSSSQALNAYNVNKHKGEKDNYEKDLYHAVIDWEKLRDKEYLSYEQIQRISSYMSQNNFEKKSLDYMDKDASYDMQGLKERKWLRTDKVWFEAFDEAPEKKVRYIRRMRENGEKLNKEPRILLSTIHGVKGGECDNVVLLTDLSLNTQRNFERNPDDENRLFYVGATRTKNHLHIIRPKDIYKGYKI